MSIYNLGRVLPIFTGEYDNNKTYNNLDVVLYNGSSYVALNQTQGNLPTDTNHWAIVALAGTLSPEQVEYIQNQVIQYVQGQGYVIDNNYTHTDNNFTDAEKAKLDGIDMSTKQDVLQSGINIMTINHNSILGSGNLDIQTGGGGTTDYTQLSNKPSINGTTLEGNVTLPTMSDLDNKQDTLVSGTNIATINGNNLLNGGNINIEGGTPVQYNKTEVDLTQVDKIQGYLSINNYTITTSSTEGIYTYLVPVQEGEHYIAYVTPDGTTTSRSNYCIIEFSQNKPVIGSTLELRSAFAAYGYASNSTPQKGTMEVVAPYDGWLAFYYNANYNVSTLYKTDVDEYNTPEYDTYIEEDIYEKYVNTLSGSSDSKATLTKRYKLNPNINYKIIYRHYGSQSSNSYTFYDDNGVVKGNSDDAGVSGTQEYRMVDLTVPEGATQIELKIIVQSATTPNSGGGQYYASGSIGVGMGALMKPLLDDGTMPQNEIVYCVSKIKKPLLPYNYTTENTTFPQNELWSAWAVRFPSGHTLSGKPTPLTSFFHGSSGYVTSERMSYPTYGITLHKEINNRGIAVFDINGFGISFQSDEYSRHWGCPAAVETVKAAYNVLTERFNCRKGMVLSGISMGGAIIKSYAMTYPEDCVACAMEAPSEMGGTFRRDGGVAEAVSTAWDGDSIELIKGYTPLAMPLVVQSITVDNNTYDVLRKVDSITLNYMFGTTGSGVNTQVNNQLYAPFPVEAVIWHGDADVNVPLSYSLQFVATTRNAGSNVKLRLCPNCDHDLNLFPWVKDEVINYIESKLR